MDYQILYSVSNHLNRMIGYKVGGFFKNALKIELYVALLRNSQPVLSLSFFILDMEMTIFKIIGLFLNGWR